MLSYILIILSLLLESIISIIINIPFLESCFLLITLIIIYPYYKNKKMKYIIMCFIFGIIYDILFTNTMFISSIVYVLCGLLIDLFYKYIDNNIYSFSFLNLIIIIFYRTIVYTLLSILDYLRFDISILFIGILNSIVLNLLYGLILFVIVNKKKV